MRHHLVVAMLAVGSACGASSDPPGATDRSGGEPAPPGATCPLTIDRTTRTIEDTIDGVVIEFTTPSPANLPALRARVEALARAHERRGRAGSGGRVAAVAAVEKRAPDDSVRLVLRPRDPATLDAVRASLRASADDLVRRHCEPAAADRR